MFIKAIRAHCMIACRREQCHGCPFGPWSARQCQVHIFLEKRERITTARRAAAGRQPVNNIPVHLPHPPEGEDLYFRDETWDYVMKECGIEAMVAARMAGEGREYFITSESAMRMFGLEDLLRGIELGDVSVRWGSVKWFIGRSRDLIDEYSGPWIPLSGFISYRLTPAARRQQ